MHQENWDPEDPRDYVDTYLTEIEKVLYLKINKGHTNVFEMTNAHA